MRRRRTRAAVLVLVAVSGGPRGDAVAEPEAATHVVRRGESLWSIAREVLGSGSRWEALYRANRDQIADPEVLYVGQRLRFPPPDEAAVLPAVGAGPD